jgi:alpha-L-fucosidase
MTHRVDWFNEARLGMFIHWGAYSVGARGEWIMNRERIPLQEYTDVYAAAWQAGKYDPQQWVDLARDAGAGYLILTTRHHDGFALWDSKVNPFNAARLGPGRDLIAPFADAVRRGGLKLGFYYSPASWPHPDYPGPFFRDWPGEKDWKSEESRRRFIAYYRAEIRELLTGYGKVDLFWYDGCIPENLDGTETNHEIRRLQPDILITKRNGPPYDIDVCEQAITPKPPGTAWEACFTLGRDSNAVWGYSPANRYKSVEDLLSLLLTTAGSAGNLVLNIGPKPDGTVVEEEAHLLREVGKWLRRNPGFLSHSEFSPFSWQSRVLVTLKGNRVFLHLTHDPRGTFCWPELKNRVVAARFLATQEPVTFRQTADGRLFLENLPSPLPDQPFATIELEVEGRPEPLTPKTTFWIPQ